MWLLVLPLPLPLPFRLVALCPCGDLSDNCLTLCLNTGKIILRSGCRALVVGPEAVTRGLVSSPDRGVSPSVYALLVTALFGLWILKVLLEEFPNLVNDMIRYHMCSYR